MFTKLLIKSKSEQRATWISAKQMLCELAHVSLPLPFTVLRKHYLPCHGDSLGTREFSAFHHHPKRI